MRRSTSRLSGGIRYDAGLPQAHRSFDDPNLISVAGLAPVMALAERARLHELVAEHITVPASAEANAAVKIPAVVAGMVAGADSISDLDLVRHGGMGRLFDRLRAPAGNARRAIAQATSVCHEVAANATP